MPTRQDGMKANKAGPYIQTCTGLTPTDAQLPLLGVGCSQQEAEILGDLTDPRVDTFLSWIHRTFKKKGDVPSNSDVCTNYFRPSPDGCGTMPEPPMIDLAPMD